MTNHFSAHDIVLAVTFSESVNYIIGQSSHELDSGTGKCLGTENMNSIMTIEVE
jgi:hypothetical protein